MVTRRLIKSLPFSDGELFGTIGTQRKKIAECTPVIEVYRHDNPVRVMGGTSHALKSYHAAIVLCGEPDFAPGMDYGFLQKITAYDMKADILLRGNVVKGMNFYNLYPETIDPRGEWVFSIENAEGLIDELMALNIV